MFCIKTTKHLDIRRDMKEFSLVGCCIDKRQKSRGIVKIRFIIDVNVNSIDQRSDCTFCAV